MAITNFATKVYTRALRYHSGNTSKGFVLATCFCRARGMDAMQAAGKAGGAFAGWVCFCVLRKGVHGSVQPCRRSLVAWGGGLCKRQALHRVQLLAPALWLARKGRALLAFHQATVPVPEGMRAAAMRYKAFQRLLIPPPALADYHGSRLAWLFIIEGLSRWLFWFCGPTPSMTGRRKRGSLKQSRTIWSRRWPQSNGPLLEPR